MFVDDDDCIGYHKIYTVKYVHEARHLAAQAKDGDKELNKISSSHYSVLAKCPVIKCKCVQ